MKSQVYWQKRFETLEASQINKGVEYYDRLSEKYRQAISETEKEISKWYTRYATNNQITLTEAQKRLNSKELAEFHMNVKEYIKKGRTLNYSDTWAKQLESTSTKYHVSRLEALKVQMQQQAEAVFGNETDDISNLATKIYTDGYYHTAYEVQKGIGIGTDFAKLDADKVNLFINEPWASDGKNFSARIWNNRQNLVNELDTKLTQCIIQGKSPQSVISEISKRFDVSKSQAGNLVMTECAFFSSAAQKDSFNALDVEEFEIVATLDNHTSTICQDLDGKHFKMKDFKPGITAPPFHCRCRSTTCPYFADEKGLRAARDENDKYYTVPDDMTYGEWKKQYVQNDNSLNESDISGIINNKILNAMVDTLNNNNVVYNPVSMHQSALSENEIINILHGGDLTKGSCASLGLSYIGQKNGMDVIDFRGGGSQAFFSLLSNLKDIIKFPNINPIIATAKSTLTVGNQLLQQVDVGKEYLMIVGKHAAIVRRFDANTIQYLELQSSTASGWTNFNGNPKYTLSHRFGCMNARGRTEEGFMVDVKQFKGSKELKKLLGYINTDVKNQKKGVAGYVK